MKRIAQYLIRFALWLAPDLQVANGLQIMWQPTDSYAIIANCDICVANDVTYATTPGGQG